MAERLAMALLGTSLVIDLHPIPADALPVEVAVSAVTMAELAAGPAAATDVARRGRRLASSASQLLSPTKIR